MAKYIYTEERMKFEIKKAIALGPAAVQQVKKALQYGRENGGITIKRTAEFLPPGALTAAPSWPSAAALRRDLCAPDAELENLYFWNVDGVVPEKLRGRRRVLSAHSAYLELSANNEHGHSRLDFKAGDLRLLGVDCFALTYSVVINGREIGRQIVAVYKVIRPATTAASKGA